MTIEWKTLKEKKKSETEQNNSSSKNKKYGQYDADHCNFIEIIAKFQQKNLQL